MIIRTSIAAVLFSCSFGVALADDTAVVATADTNTQSQPAPEHLQKTCLRETGSRIPSRHSDDCLAVHGEAYSRNDLESSGQSVAGEGLWRLDPALTVRRR